eukprot:Lankesteria_metandrocarpae@DN553_c1_g1_i1.p1
MSDNDCHSQPLVHHENRSNSNSSRDVSVGLALVSRKQYISATFPSETVSPLTSSTTTSSPFDSQEKQQQYPLTLRERKSDISVGLQEQPVSSYSDGNRGTNAINPERSELSLGAAPLHSSSLQFATQYYGATDSVSGGSSLPPNCLKNLFSDNMNEPMMTSPLPLDPSDDSQQRSENHFQSIRGFQPQSELHSAITAAAVAISDPRSHADWTLYVEQQLQLQQQLKQQQPEYVPTVQQAPPPLRQAPAPAPPQQVPAPLQQVPAPLPQVPTPLQQAPPALQQVSPQPPLQQAP